MTRHLLASVAALLVFTTLASAQTARVTGTVTYRERVALAPDAAVEVSIEDVSRAGAVALVLASTRIERAGQVPIEFSISYDPARVESSRRYAVRARIVEGARVLFATSQPALVITQGHGQDAHLVLRSVSAAASAPAPAATASQPAPASAAPRASAPLPRPVPLVNLPATFTGTLPCADCAGIRYVLNLFPDDTFFLKTSYVGKPDSSAKDELGSWVLSSDRRALVLQPSQGEPEAFAIRDNVTLRKLDREGRDITSAGSYDLRRAGAFQPFAIAAQMKGAVRMTGAVGSFTECSTGHSWPIDVTSTRDLQTAYTGAVKKPGDAVLITVDASIVPRADDEASVSATRVLKASPSESCQPRFAAAPLAGTYWALGKLADVPVTASASAAVPSLSLRPDAQSFSGSDGCNRLAGNYQVSGDTILFLGVGTLTACRGGSPTGLAGALKIVTRYRVLGNALDLYDAENKRVARFEAREQN